MDISAIVDSMIETFNKELIAKTDLISDVSSGDTTIFVKNSFHFYANQEIVFIDYGYNDQSSPHFQKFEYSVIKEVVDTNTIIVTTPVIDNWLTSESSFIQKTIGHDPMYTENILFGDREVIPTDNMAITVEPVSVTNEWIYLQGGLSEESRITIMIYGQSVETEEGMKILSKYAKEVYDILNGSLHINVNDYQTPLTRDITAGDDFFYICDTPENRENFEITVEKEFYMLQDNSSPKCTRYDIIDRTFEDCEIRLQVDKPFEFDYSLSEFGVAIRIKRYFYDSRVDNVTFGVTQKGSAILRAAELSWFGKEVNEIEFPQRDRKVICFDPNDTCCSSSSED